VGVFCAPLPATLTQLRWMSEAQHLVPYSSTAEQPLVAGIIAVLGRQDPPTDPKRARDIRRAAGALMINKC
jgi:hypothetical protein